MYLMEYTYTYGNLENDKNLVKLGKDGNWKIRFYIFMFWGCLIS